MRKILERKLARLTERRDALKAKAQASESIEEVRSINAQLEEIAADIADVNDEIAALDEQERNAVPANAELRNANIAGNKNGENKDMYESVEYRKAFMAYVQRGTAIPAQFMAEMPQTRAANTTGDVAPIIPLNIMREIINTYKKKYGETVTESLSRIRLGHAKEMIAEGRSVTETAAACGFADPSYFSKCFRRAFGHSPSRECPE